MENGITPVMNVGSGYGDGLGFGGGFMGIFGLLVLLGIMNGGFGFGGGNGNSNAIQNDINRGFDNQNLQAQTRDILSAVTSGTAQSVAATNGTFHDTLAVLNDKYSELQRDIAALGVGQANLLAHQNECCCNLKTAILTSDMNTNAQVQKVLDAISENKIEALRDKVSALELAQATNNVVRYPNAMTYAYNANPFCSNGCGCGSF